MRACFIIETPFHLLNCLNYLYNYKKEKNIVADAYICRQKQLTKETAKCLLETGLFKNVYMYDEKQTGLKEKISKLKKVFAPHRYIQEISGNAIKKIPRYEALYIAVPTNMIFALRQLLPEAGIIYMDDGLGSYVNNVRTVSFEKSVRLLKKFKKKVPDFSGNEVWVNSAKYANTSVADKKMQLPELSSADDKLKEILYKVFDYKKTDDYKEHKMVLLTMPDDFSSDDFVKTNEAVLDIVAGQNDYIVRPHPREDRDYKEHICDRSKNMWELIVADDISDEHVLISMFSTAQVVPKLFFDKEPWIIFTYHLYENVYSEEVKKNIDSFFSMMKEIYRDKEKVVVVETREELKDILNRIESDK